MTIPNWKSYELVIHFLNFSFWFRMETFWKIVSNCANCKSQCFPRDWTSHLLLCCRLHKYYVQILAETMSSIGEKSKYSHLVQGLPTHSVNACNRSPVSQHFLLLPAITCGHDPCALYPWEGFHPWAYFVNQWWLILIIKIKPWNAIFW